MSCKRLFLEGHPVVSNVYFVVGAYAVSWIVLLAYLFRVQSLLRRSRAALAHARSAGGAT